jgi:hypothetical protein
MRRLFTAIGLLIITGGLLCLISCGTSSNNPGQVTGSVTSPNGQVTIPGATVNIASYLAYTKTATTDSTGKYTFDNVPDGNYTLTAAKGNWSGQTTISVKDGSVNGDTQIRFDTSPDDIAVVQGLYDSVETILDELGVQYTFIDAADLQDYTIVSSYKIIFLNCGCDTTYASDPVVMSNLQNFVAGGRSLYASDWAFEYVEDAWPSAIDFPSDPYIGQSQNITADVVDSALAAYLGSTTVPITFNLSAWVVMNGVGSGTTIHISGDFVTDDGPMTDKPILVSFMPSTGSGRVVYTSFHYEAQITDESKKVLEYFIFSL